LDRLDNKFSSGYPAFVKITAMDNTMLLPPVDSLNEFISKVFIAIAIGALVFGLIIFGNDNISTLSEMTDVKRELRGENTFAQLQ
jgi:hypothetical protein